MMKTSLLNAAVCLGLMTGCGGTALKIERHIASSGYDRVRCHANPVALPVDGKVMIITQKLLINAIDCFSGVEMIVSEDNGKSWNNTGKIPALADRIEPDGLRTGFNTSVTRRCADGRIMVLVTTYTYNAKNRRERTRPQQVEYTFFHPQEKRWDPLRKLELPAPGGADVLAVNAQLIPVDNGFLLPYSVRDGKFYSMIARISTETDGTLKVVETGEPIRCNTGRGVLEPSLCRLNGRYFLTLRNDESGMITASNDWKKFPAAGKLEFSGGKWLGNRNTMTRLIHIGGRLFLVYTRSGLNNDHVFRNRAPLLIAEVDPEKLTVIPETETVAVPERGARLGNFTAVSCGNNRAYISVAEWMQSCEPEWYDCRKCEKYGADNRIWYVTLELPYKK